MNLNLLTATVFSSDLITTLDEIADLSYPSWLLDTAIYLPKLDLTCIADSGKKFFKKAVKMATKAPVTGFFNAIKAACSFDSLVLSGGYISGNQELKMDVVVETKTGRSV